MVSAQKALFAHSIMFKTKYGHLVTSQARPVRIVILTITGSLGSWPRYHVTAILLQINFIKPKCVGSTNADAVHLERRAILRTLQMSFGDKVFKLRCPITHEFASRGHNVLRSQGCLLCRFWFSGLLTAQRRLTLVSDSPSFYNFFRSWTPQPTLCSLLLNRTPFEFSLNQC